MTIHPRLVDPLGDLFGIPPEDLRLHAAVEAALRRGEPAIRVHELTERHQ